MKAEDTEAWEPRKVIIGGEEMVVPERITVRFIDDVGDTERWQRCGWLLEACSHGFEGSDKQTFLDSMPEEYRIEGEQFFEIARWDREQRAA